MVSAVTFLYCMQVEWHYECFGMKEKRGSLKSKIVIFSVKMPTLSNAFDLTLKVCS